MPERVEVRSLHAVRVWIDERIKSGRFKRCAHLVVLPLNEYHEGVNVPATHIYLPHCNRDSFTWSQARLGRDSELHILRRVLHSEPIACPPKCRSYENRSWGATKKTAGRLFHIVQNWLRAFSQLSWRTQTLIILLLILLFAPAWIPPILELLRAFR